VARLGPDLAFFYNDAYMPTLGTKHPDALGRPMKDVWKEVFTAVEDRIVSVMRDGVATWDKALMLLLERSGYLEETYHTFSYSPLRGDSGAIEGLVCVVTEETERVISERRLATLLTLSTALLPVRSREELSRAVHEALQSNMRDFPFGFVCFFDEPRKDTALECAPWPFEQIKAGADVVRVPLKDFSFEPPKGPWSVPPREAIILPLRKSNIGPPAGALVLGLNPHRLHSAETTGIRHLLAGQISGALATVDANLSQIAETQRLQQLFEQTPSFIAVLRGPEHRFELANPGYLQLIGHRKVVGLTVRDALPDIAGQGFFELLDKVY
jgi:PAS domain-containing protein